MRDEDRALQVTRFEVIDETGRVLTRRPCEIELSYQDEGKTLKVFTTGGRAVKPERHCDTCAHLTPFELAPELNTCPVVNIRIHSESAAVFGCNQWAGSLA